MGLLGTLDPRQVGGVEPSLDHVPYAVRSATNPTTLEELDTIIPDDYDSSDAEDEEVSASLTTKKDKGKEKEKEKKLGPGMARIIRDSEGKVLRIVVGNEDGDEVEEEIVEPSRGGDDSESEEEEEEEKPWGEEMKDWDVKDSDFRDEEMQDEDVERDPRKLPQGIPIEGGLRNVQAKTDVVRGTSTLSHSNESTNVNVDLMTGMIYSTRSESSEWFESRSTLFRIRKRLVGFISREVR